jgi:hypothetical protein
MQNKISKKIKTLGIRSGVFWMRIFPFGKFPKWKKKTYWKISGFFPFFQLEIFHAATLFKSNTTGATEPW